MYAEVLQAQGSQIRQRNFLQSLVYAIDPTTPESEACKKLD